MNKPIVTVDQLSKKYRLGLIGATTFKNEIADKFARMKAGTKEKNLNIEKSNKEFWALRDISFEVPEGEVFGIIGKNGAGKSTLLKLLSRITEPTSGRAVLRGNVASLLEVGTGFHEELSGRDNVYLNGTILGMRIPEIRKQFDNIVDFSGLEKFIDTPVKRYSSGMRVRLAFAVAAHLQPKILIVDEVLAVGDFEFQQKCVDRMSGIAESGRTVLFVSHNMGAVAQLCDRVMHLENGTIKGMGSTHEQIEEYTKGFDLGEDDDISGHRPLNGAHLGVDVEFISAVPNKKQFKLHEALAFKIKIKGNRKLKGLTLGFVIYDQFSVPIGNVFSRTPINIEEAEEKEVLLELEVFNIAPGHFHCGFGIGYGDERSGQTCLDQVRNLARFEILSFNDKGESITNWKNSTWGNIVFKESSLKELS